MARHQRHRGSSYQHLAAGAIKIAASRPYGAAAKRGGMAALGGWHRTRHLGAAAARRPQHRHRRVAHRGGGLGGISAAASALARPQLGASSLIIKINVSVSSSRVARLGSASARQLIGAAAAAWRHRLIIAAAASASSARKLGARHRV